VIFAAVVAGSVALLGFGLHSGIEAMASVIVIWRFTGTRLDSRPPSGAPGNWWRPASSCSPPTSPSPSPSGAAATAAPPGRCPPCCRGRARAGRCRWPPRCAPGRIDWLSGCWVFAVSWAPAYTTKTQQALKCSHPAEPGRHTRSVGGPASAPIVEIRNRAGTAWSAGEQGGRPTTAGPSPACSASNNCAPSRADMRSKLSAVACPRQAQMWMIGAGHGTCPCLC
jgi:hypothetical protein